MDHSKKQNAANDILNGIPIRFYGIEMCWKIFVKRNQFSGKPAKEKYWLSMIKYMSLLAFAISLYKVVSLMAFDTHLRMCRNLIPYPTDALGAHGTQELR